MTPKTAVRSEGETLADKHKLMAELSSTSHDVFVRLHDEKESNSNTTPDVDEAGDVSLTQIASERGRDKRAGYLVTADELSKLLDREKVPDAAEKTQRLIELYGRDAFEREHEEASINELHSHVSRAFKTLSLQQTELTAQVLSLKEAMSELSLAMPKVEEKDGALEVENLE